MYGKRTEETELLMPQGRQTVSGGHMGATALYGCISFQKRRWTKMTGSLINYYLLLLIINSGQWCSFYYSLSICVWYVCMCVCVYIYFKVASSNIGSSWAVLFSCNSSSHEQFNFHQLDFVFYFLLAFWSTITSSPWRLTLQFLKVLIASKRKSMSD